MNDSVTDDIIFSTKLVECRYADFPYPKKLCIYCNKMMTLTKTLHLVNSPSDYKAIYICYNKSCDAYDEPASKAYAKVYYSSPRAAKYLDGINVGVQQPRKE